MRLLLRIALLLVPIGVLMCNDRAAWYGKVALLSPIAWVGWQLGLLWPVLFAHVDGWWTVRRFVGGIEKHRDFTPRPRDIVLSTFPRSGTHMTGVMIMEVLAKGKANFTDLNKVAFSMELPALLPLPDGDAKGDELQPRRLLLTHMSAPLFNPNLRNGAKYVTVVRDPIDVVCSLAKQVRPLLGPLTPPTALFAHLLFDEANMKGWAEFTSAWWELRAEPALLQLSYSSVRADMGGAVDQLADLLGVVLTVEERARVLERSGIVFEKLHHRHGQVVRGPLSPPPDAMGFWGSSYGGAEAKCGDLEDWDADILRQQQLARLDPEARKHFFP